jgi:hypothetical protein
VRDEANLSSTRSAPSDDVQRPRTSPGARQTPQHRTTDCVANTILNWSDNLAIPPSEPVALSSSEREASTKKRAVSASPTTQIRSSPGPQQHMEAAGNIRAYLTAVEGSSVEETERTLEFAGSMMAQMQRRKTWSADASQSRDRDMHLIYGPRPRNSAERQAHLRTGIPFATNALIDKKERLLSIPVSALPLLDSDKTNAARVKAVDGTWSAEAEIPRDMTGAHSTTSGRQSHTNPLKRSQTQKNQLPSVAPDKRQQGFSSTSKKQASSTTTNQQHTRHTSRPGQVPSRSGSKNGGQSRAERTTMENTPATPKKQPHSRMRRPETPEQALAKLVSPSELNAALPAQRDRRIAPV